MPVQCIRRIQHKELPSLKIEKYSATYSMEDKNVDDNDIKFSRMCLTGATPEEAVSRLDSELAQLDWVGHMVIGMPPRLIYDGTKYGAEIYFVPYPVVVMMGPSVNKPLYLYDSLDTLVQ